MHSGISQAREFDDPPGLHDKTEFLLREWVNMYHSPAAGRDSTKAFSAFVGQVRIIPCGAVQKFQPKSEQIQLLNLPVGFSFLEKKSENF